MHKNLSVYLINRYGCHAISYFNTTDFIFNVNLILKVNVNKNIVSQATDHNTFTEQKESKEHLHYQRKFVMTV